jgi:S-adenosylmethionine hydrolase
MSIITLLTDFGLQDEYVGVVKGVILSINPAATLVDITHGVAAQDVHQAGDILSAAFNYFPKGSIHLIIVDPGVGSGRSIIGLRLNGHLFLAPNNGVLTHILDRYDVEEIVEVSNGQYFLNPVSQTFHGRDIFAPVAAHLCLGVELKAMGPAMPEKKALRLQTERPQIDAEGVLKGKVVGVDRFGNLITNISLNHLEPLSCQKQGRVLTIKAGKTAIQGLAEHYSQVAKGEPLAIMGSRRCLEVVVREGSASQALNLKKGDPVLVYSSAVESPTRNTE